MTAVFPHRVFITGTDTGVGKTMIAAILMAGFRGLYWKPVQSGIAEGTDTEWIGRATGLPKKHFQPETYRLLRPLSPHAAAAAQGVRIDLKAFHLPDTPDRLIVEGAGGVMVPLNENALMLDLMKQLGLPVLLVARSELGTINHTLLSLEQLRRAGVEVLGVVMNGTPNRINREAISDFGQARVVAAVEPLSPIIPATLKKAFDQHFS